MHQHQIIKHVELERMWSNRDSMGFQTPTRTNKHVQMGFRRVKNLRRWDSISYVYHSKSLFWRYQLWPTLHFGRVLYSYTWSKKKSLESKQSCFRESGVMHHKPKIFQSGGPDISRTLLIILSASSKTVMTDTNSFNDYCKHPTTDHTVNCSSDRSNLSALRNCRWLLRNSQISFSHPNNLVKWWIGPVQFKGSRSGLVNLDRLNWSQHVLTSPTPGAGMLVAKVVVKSICAAHGRETHQHWWVKTSGDELLWDAPSPIVGWVSDWR